MKWSEKSPEDIPITQEISRHYATLRSVSLPDGQAGLDMTRGCAGEISQSLRSFEMTGVEMRRTLTCIRDDWGMTETT